MAEVHRQPSNRASAGARRLRLPAAVLLLTLSVLLLPAAAGAQTWSFSASNVTHDRVTLTLLKDGSPYNDGWGYVKGGTETCNSVSVNQHQMHLTGLTPETQYTYQAVSNCQLAWTIYDEATFTTTAAPTVPLKPGTPTATAGIKSAALSWSSGGDGGSPITGWEYIKNRGDGWETAWHAIPGSGAGTTSYTVTGLIAGTTYHFKVRAVNSVGDGAESDGSNTVTVLAATAPPAPGKPTATRGNGQVALSWSSNGDGGAAITTWEYDQNAGGGFSNNWIRIPNSGPGTTSYTVTNLHNGTPYSFKVRAVNSVGNGAESPASDAVTPATTPLAPRKPTATSGDAAVTLNWTWSTSIGNGSAITHWEYDQNEDGGGFNGNWTQMSGSGESTSSYTVSSLTNGKAYQFQVRAVNGVGAGAASPASDAVTPAVAPGKPDAPSVTSGDSQISYSWTAPDDNGMDITGYDVEYRAKGDASWTSKGSVGAGTTSGGIRSLTNGTTYQVRVRAYNKIRKGPWSDPGEGMPTGIPGTPAAPTVTGGSASGELKVSWVAPSNGGSAITAYYVHYSTCSSGCSWTSGGDLAGNVTTTTFTGLENGKKYWVRVKAANANGNGEWSATGSGRPSAPPPPPPPPGTKTGGVDSVTETSATLMINNHTGEWSYQQTSSQTSLRQKSLASQLAACVNMSEGTYSASLTGLESGTTYSYEVFSAPDCPSASSVGTVQFTTDETSNPPPDDGNDDQTGGGQTGGGGDTGGGGGGGGGGDPEPVPAIPGLGAALLAGLLALAGIVRRRAAG